MVQDGSSSIVVVLRRASIEAPRANHTQHMKLWSVGHSTRSLDEFVALLRAHGIDSVADIRAVPRSRRHPHFHTAALERSLPERGIAYALLPRLGGFRRARNDSPNDAWRNQSFRGYADYG